MGLNVCWVSVKVVVIILKDARQLKLVYLQLFYSFILAKKRAIIQGIDIRTSKVERYICRPKESGRIQRRHSKFWVGLYGKSWLNNLHLCIDWVGQWMRINRNKQLDYQRGLKAIDQIQPSF